MHMCIHRQSRPVQGKEQHAGGRLGTNPWQAQQVGPSLIRWQIRDEIQRGGPPLLLQPGDDLLDARCLDAGEPTHADRLGHRLGIGGSDLLPGGKGAAQRGKSTIRVRIRSVLREDRLDQLVQRRLLRFECGLAIVRQESPVYL